MKEEKNFYQRIQLPYKLNDLEPIIDFKTMYYHYNILHLNYEKKLNEVIEQNSEIKKNYPSLEKLMNNLDNLFADTREEIRFFGGGLINHNFFFQNLVKFNIRKENYRAKGEQFLKQIETESKSNQSGEIKKEFINLSNLQKELVKNALKVRGSGWTWLVLDKNKKLQIINTANQDNPWMINYYPLIAIDIWEHAYFLYYGTDRENYVKKLVENLLNWDFIITLYLQYRNKN